MPYPFPTNKPKADIFTLLKSKMNQKSIKMWGGSSVDRRLSRHMNSICGTFICNDMLL